jgi:hypothetical protein
LNLIKQSIIVIKLLKKFSLSKKRRGISPILATVIIFGLIITGVMVTFIQVVPFIEQAQSEETIAVVRNSFIDLDSAIKTLISESGTPGGFRTIIFNKPSGRLDYESDHYFISLKLLDQDDTSVYDFFELQEISALDWIYNSPRSVLPRGTSKYLTGPSPYEIRNRVFLTGPFSTTDYQDITDLTLSHLDDRRHHITLSYRISIYLTITTQPQPEIRIQVFLILLKANFEKINAQYKQLTVNINQNFSTPYTLSDEILDGAAGLKLVWEDNKVTGTTTYSLWSTQSIQGLTQVSIFNIVVQTLVYEISIGTS